MIAIKKALRAKLVGDATLVALLGGQRIYQRAPELETDNFDVWVTFWAVVEGPDVETGRVEEVYQFDIWGASADKTDAVAERIVTVLAWRQGTDGTGTLPALTGRRLADLVTQDPSPPDMVDASGPRVLHHKVRQFRVASYPV